MEVPCHWAKPSVSTLLILSKHLPAFPGISFIFLFIVPGFLYPKLGTWLHSAKHLRLTNKQTDRPKDNKACGQTWWWWTLSWGTHLITLSPLSVTKVPPGTQEKLSHRGRTRWLDSGCTMFPDLTCTVQAIYDLFIWNTTLLTYIMVNQLRRPPHIFEACGGLGVSEHWGGLFKASSGPVWSDHSSQPGWCLARSVHSRGVGWGRDLWWNLVFV